MLHMLQHTLFFHQGNYYTYIFYIKKKENGSERAGCRTAEEADSCRLAIPPSGPRGPHGLRPPHATDSRSPAHGSSALSLRAACGAAYSVPYPESADRRLLRRRDETETPSHDGNTT